MALACPQCGARCGWFDRACGVCGLALSVGAVTRFYLKRARKTVAIECPCCRRGAVPIGETVCPTCGAEPTFQDAVQATVDPPRRRLQRWFNFASPRTKRRVQWLYLLASAFVLWWLTAYVAYVRKGHWVGPAMLSILYVAAFGFFGSWLLPRRVLQGISRHATAKVKLALSLNFFSGMLLLQLAIGAWWAMATVQATLFLVLWLAAHLLNTYILPMAASTRAAFLGGDDSYDPTSSQGRNVRLD